MGIGELLGKPNKMLRITLTRGYKRRLSREFVPLRLKRVFIKFFRNKPSLYRKIPIIIPGLIFVQKSFLLGLFSGEPILGGAYYWKEFCVSKWIGLDSKNSLK